MDTKTVGAVATLTGVSVRTLHHCDHIGLVVPSTHTPARYRGYTDADIERLHLVLVYRSVGLPLDEIRTLLDDPDADVLAHLQRQRDLLAEHAVRLQHTIEAVQELMTAHRRGIQLSASLPRTAHRSSGSTTAATTCISVLCGCIWPTNDSPATTTTPNPAWPNSFTTSWWLASSGARNSAPDG